MAQRLDIIEFKAKRTDEGYVKDYPVVGRVGIQTYLNADGTTRKELRLPEEVFHPDSLASFKGKPITDNHPKEHKVTPENYKRLTIGAILSEGRQDGDNVRTEIIINDSCGVDKAVNGGKRGLSLGYSLDLDETPGEWNGERYDAVQRNIRINHLALVKYGRAGEAARLNIDQAVQVINQKEPKMADKTLVTVRLDSGISYEAPPEVANELERIRKDVKDLAETLKGAKKTAGDVEAERDKLKARVDGLDDELKKASEEAYKKAVEDIKSRADVNDVADAYGVDHKDSMTTEEVKKAVILSVRKDADLEGKSSAYIDGAFDLIKEKASENAMSNQRRKVNGDGGGKKQRNDSGSARQRMIDNMKNPGGDK